MTIEQMMARSTLPIVFQEAWSALSQCHAQETVFASSDGISKEYVSEEQFLDSAWMTVRTELWWMASDKTTPKVTIRSVYTRFGSYVGDEKMATLLHERGIQPQLASDEHSVCSIGFSHTEQRWYGWSHRAICSFGMGDMLFDASFCPNDCEIPYIKHGTIPIVNLSQARMAAKNFAASVN